MPVSSRESYGVFSFISKKSEIFYFQIPQCHYTYVNRANISKRIRNMPPVEVHRKMVKSAAKKDSAVSLPHREDFCDTNAKKLSGSLKIKNPRIIEEIAESDLLA
jgi:hypothetical protein